MNAGGMVAFLSRGGVLEEPQPRGRTSIRKTFQVLVSSIVLIVGLGLAGCSSGAARGTSGQAAEFLYWADHTNGTIGRATLDGKHVQPSFIAHAGAAPCNIAIGGGYIFWGSDGAQGIGRADLDGSHVEVQMVKYTVTSPIACGVAASGNHLYWTDNNDGWIGRSTLDGTDVDAHFIKTPDPVGLAIQGNYIYWGSYGNNALDTDLGRANLDGTGVNSKFISGASNAGFLTVTDRYLYWGNAGPASAGTTIGRARLDGSGVTQNVLPAPGVSALAVNGNQIYWANDVSLVTGTIDVATLDGSQPNRTFIHDSQHIGAPFGFVIAPGA